MRNLPRLVDELIAGGKSAQTPAAAVMQGTLPEQRTCVSTLSGLPEAARQAGISAPAVVVVGDVVGLRDGLSWWERKPLFGCSVLVTRASQQAVELAAALRSVGAAPVLEPMIEFAAIEEAEGKAKIALAIARLDQTQAIVFTSSNAVRYFAHAYHDRAGDHDQAVGALSPRQWAEIRTFCVGERTAEAALAAGFPVHVVATGRSDAEALLGQLLQALPTHDATGVTSGARVLIPGSQIARTIIADGLRATGIEVDAVPFYENRRPQIDVAGLRGRLARGELFALTFTSPSTVDHFLDCLDDESREAAGKCMIVAIGRTTARTLEGAGLPATVVPARPDISLMVEAMVSAAAG